MVQIGARQVFQIPVFCAWDTGGKAHKVADVSCFQFLRKPDYFPKKR